MFLLPRTEGKTSDTPLSGGGEKSGERPGGGGVQERVKTDGGRGNEKKKKGGKIRAPLVERETAQSGPEEFE